MNQPLQNSALDIGEDIAHQRKVWRVERISWTLMGMAICAGLLGFAGHGLFSERNAVSANGLEVTYHRFERSHAQTSVELALPPPDGTQTRLRLGQDFLAHVEVVRFEPEPAAAELGRDFSTYVFNASEGGTIQLHFKPLRPGTLALALGLEGETPLTLYQFVYP